MSRLLRLVLMLAIAVAPAGPFAQSGGSRLQQADGIVRLLSDLEAALTSGLADRFTPLAAPGLPAADAAVFALAVDGGGVTSAAVRERARRPLDNGNRVQVLAEVFVARGHSGRLATWVITVQPRAGAPDRFEIAGLQEPAAFGPLINLTLDTRTEFAVHDLVLRGPDLTVRMSAGSAFVAKIDGQVTALVLHGSGAIAFDPPDPAEQGQLRAFCGHPAVEAPLDTAFVRIAPEEFAARLGEHTLLPASLDAGEASHAQSVFDDYVTKTYTVDLRDLATGSWSLPPPPGALVVEFHTSRFGWLTYVREPGSAEDVNLFDRPHGRNLSVYASAERLASRGRLYNEDDLVPYDIDHYALDVRFDPRNDWIAGHASVTLHIRTALAHTLTLRLAEPLTVSSVTLPGLGRLLAIRSTGQNSIIVNLPGPAVRGTRLTLDIDYSGRLPPDPAADREAPGATTPMTTGDPSAPPPPPPGLTQSPEPRFVYSNEPPWYPQSIVSDYATATTRFEVPSEYQIVSNGTLVSSSVGAAADPGTGGTRSMRTAEYVVPRPARYLSCLITRLVEVGREHVSVPAVAPPEGQDAGAGAPAVVDLEVVATPRVASIDRTLPARVADMVRAYAKLVGEAPYATLTVAGIEDNLPGGHSPATMALWFQPLPTTPFTWASDPVSLDSTYPQIFLAHEVAHQWWGQGVGWENYHEQWLSEGLAQYFAAVFAGMDRGPEMLTNLIGQMRQTAAAYSAKGPISLGYRLGHVQGDSRIFRAILYDKSAVVLHMLRRLIGDDAFFAGLRRFYQAKRFQKAGTEDLRAAFEAETPMRLERFFERWIGESALPRLRVSTHVDAGGHSAVVRVEQVGEVFDLPLTVTVQYSDGRNEPVTIPVTAAVTERTIPLTGPVRRIVTRDDLTLAEYVK